MKVIQQAITRLITGPMARITVTIARSRLKYIELIKSFLFKVQSDKKNLTNILFLFRRRPRIVGKWTVVRMSVATVQSSS